jgi:cysteine-rich repeat protein
MRTQNASGAKLDGYWREVIHPEANPEYLGVPYTLDFNLGIYPNPLRPHWQWLQRGADPAPYLPCSRSCSSCGDGVIHPREECDDGNIDSGDGCSDECFFEGIN